MGISREQLFRTLNIIKDGVDLEAIVKKSMVEFENHKWQEIDDHTTTSFYASQFPGSEKSCQRKMLYQLMNIPNVDPFPPKLRGQTEMGKAAEEFVVKPLISSGIVLSVNSEKEQIKFEDPDTWLSGSTDLVLDLREVKYNHVLPVDIKSKDHDVIQQMKIGARNYDEKHYQQVQAYIYFCRKFHVDMGWRDMGLLPAKAGMLYYVSRQDPTFVHQFYFKIDREVIDRALENSIHAKEMWQEDILPPRPEDWKWTEEPCKWCIHPDSLVLKSDLTWAKARWLQVGDELIGFDEEENGKSRTKYRSSFVTHNEQIWKPISRIKTTMGFVECSPDHKWLVRRSERRRWIDTIDLRIGDKIIALIEPWIEEQSKEAGWLAGFFDGEGSISKHHVCVNQNEGILLDKASDLLRKIGFNITQRKATNGNSFGDKCQRLRIEGGLAQELKFLGMIRPQRLLNKSKVLWEGMSTWSKNMNYAEVLSVEHENRQGILMAIETSTNTLIVDGLFSHNCPFKREACKKDWKEGIEKLSESNGIEFAKHVNDSYDYDEIKLKVEERWKENSQT